MPKESVRLEPCTEAQIWSKGFVRLEGDSGVVSTTAAA